MKPLIAILTASTAISAAPALAQETDLADYCQNAFFSVDDDQDGMVDNEEATRVQDGIFNDIDLNDDGSIDREEYAACTQSRQESTMQTASTDQSEESFEGLDTDQDDAVSLQEYFARASEAYDDNSLDGTWDMSTGFEQPFVNVPEGSEASDMGPMNRQMFLDLAVINFAMTDQDLDGTLTREEWINRADQNEVDISEVNQRFDETDSNADDVIDPAEFGELWQSVIGTAQGQADRDGFTDQSKGIPAYYFYLSPM